MEPEVLITTNKMNAHVDPVLAVWEWQIPVYLFLGGLTAGLLILGAVSVLRREKALGPAAQKLQLFVPVVLGLGMFALLLDLSYKVHLFRFYTTFQLTSPMSWGAWILVLVLPANVLLIAGTLEKTWPRLYDGVTARFERTRPVLAFAEGRLSAIAGANLGLGIALGIYTGILLSAYGARPFWNTAILGPIFLVSGLSSAAALVQLFSRNSREHHVYTYVDVGLIAAELFLIALMIFNMTTGAEQVRSAAELVLGGELTVFFWVFVVMIGLLLPIALEVLHLKGRPMPRFLAPVFVLAGGLIFRFFIVEAGQLTTWIGY